MKCQILFSGKNKKNINLSSAENAQRVVKVNVERSIKHQVRLYSTLEPFNIILPSFRYDLNNVERDIKVLLFCL